MTTAVLDKPARLLATGAVTIRRVSDWRIDAHVQGDTGTHRIVRDPGGWSCDCAGFTYRRTCSHVRAVRLVTTETSP